MQDYIISIIINALFAIFWYYFGKNAATTEIIEHGYIEVKTIKKGVHFTKCFELKEIKKG